MIVPVAVAGSSGETVCPGTHLDVESVQNSLFAVTASAPVADYNAVKSPVALEDVAEEFLIVTVVLAVVEVV